jgi:SAM-dependent methyltransferase
VGGLLLAAARRSLVVGRELVTPKARCFHTIQALVSGGTGLEIGGPSAIFARRGQVPVYPIAGRLDNCNFSRATVWEGRIEEGETFRFDARRAPGWQYVAEATDLRAIPTATYDFVLSSHTLEHIANPIRALSEWMRVLKDAGVLVLVLPHKDRTFDHRRPVTSLAHLIEDFASGRTEDDLTHLPEVLALHDLELDPGTTSREAFEARSARNFENRCMHHHVFDADLAVRLVDHVGLQIHAVELLRPCHILIVAQKARPATGSITRAAAIHD